MRKHGFSLVELLIVIGIISVLLTISLASYSTITKRSRDTRRKSDLAQISSALEMYRADNKFYPPAGPGWQVAGETSDAGTSGLKPYLSPSTGTKYISQIPTDPNKSIDYWYMATNLNSGHYYGYCLSAKLEVEDPADGCTPYNTQNYGVSNP